MNAIVIHINTVASSISSYKTHGAGSPASDPQYRRSGGAHGTNTVNIGDSSLCLE